MQEKINLEIITLAQTGDEVAFTKLYNEHKKHVQYLAYRILNNHHDAQDATQAVFIQVHQSIKDLKYPEYFILWLNRITLGKCNGIYRKKKVIVVDMDDFSYANKLVEDQRDYLPEQNMKFKNDKELVDYMIMNLPYEQRQVVILFYFEGLSLQEIADVTKEALGTVKSRLFLAKKKLKQHIESYQSKEKTYVDFRTIELDTLIVATLASGYQLFSGVSKGSIMVAIMSKAKHILSTGAGKGLMVTMALSTTTIAAVGVYQVTKEDTSRNNTLPQNMQTIQSNENEQDAYFTLLHWASNEQVMNHHKVEDIKDIEVAFNLLKEKQGVYWQALQARGWTRAFDNFRKK